MGEIKIYAVDTKNISEKKEYRNYFLIIDLETKEIQNLKKMFVFWCCFCSEVCNAGRHKLHKILKIRENLLYYVMQSAQKIHYFFFIVWFWNLHFDRLSFWVKSTKSQIETNKKLNIMILINVTTKMNQVIKAATKTIEQLCIINFR